VKGPVLGRLADVVDGGSAGFVAETEEGRVGLLVIRRGDQLFAYVNRCPHIGAPLDFRPGQFLTRDGAHILCANHGALFRIEDGYCITGPCARQSLTPVDIRIDGDRIVLAGPPPVSPGF